MKIIKQRSPHSAIGSATKLSIEEYEAIFTDSLEIDQDAAFSDDLPYSIREIKNTIRFFYYKES